MDPHETISRENQGSFMDGTKQGSCPTLNGLFFYTGSGEPSVNKSQ